MSGGRPSVGLRRRRTAELLSWCLDADPQSPSACCGGTSPERAVNGALCSWSHLLMMDGIPPLQEETPCRAALRCHPLQGRQVRQVPAQQGEAGPVRRIPCGRLPHRDLDGNRQLILVPVEYPSVAPRLIQVLPDSRVDSTLTRPDGSAAGAATSFQRGYTGRRPAPPPPPPSRGYSIPMGH